MEMNRYGRKIRVTRLDFLDDDTLVRGKCDCSIYKSILEGDSFHNIKGDEKYVETDG